VRVRSIAAGAGTGKTTELTRVIRESILNGECRPNAIIGTTFTIKAAGELVERVRQEFFKNGQIELGERLTESLLGTVDSVCLRLLTRFAFEAGISPDIQIIAEPEAKALQGSALEYSCSLDEMETIRLLGERLCQGDGKELNWKAQIGVITAKARENAISPDRLRAMAGQSSQELLSHFPPAAPVGSALDSALAQAIQTALQNIPAPNDFTRKTGEYLWLLKGCSRDLAEGRLKWSQWVKLTKETPAKRSLAEAQPVIRAAQCYEEHPQLRTDIEQYTQLLFEFAARALTQYQERKGERGLLDFVDLEQLTLELLQQFAVAEVISEEFDLLVVDEFQDTNPIQLALFVRLAALVKHGAVWVGDVKQAIYGFRGSDPALMDAVLARVDPERMPTLGITYRARPELVQIFNDLFISAFARDLGLPKQDVELQAKRPLNAALPVPLEFWVLSGGQVIKGGTPRQPTNLQAAQALAEGVVQLLANSNRIEDRDSGQLRPLQLRDIAILCRTNEGAVAVAEALQERSLPVTLGTGGLLSTPEACLAMACLRRMADSGDTLATAEIIALEAEHTPEQWLRDRLEFLAAHPEDLYGSGWGVEPPLAKSSVTALHQANRYLGQLTPAEALDMALGAGNVLATISRWGPSENRSAQRRANVERLRGLALQYERSCAATHRATTIAGFVFWCGELKTSKLDLKATDERADSIHLLTYHTAKGLEWPVVICNDLGNEHRTNLWEPTVRQEREFEARDPLANRRIAFWPWPFGGQQKDIPLKERIEDAAVGREALSAAAKEELRLLYVGFTRARDMLVLATREAQPSAWLDLLEAPWLQPLGKGKTPVFGLLGPSKVPYCTRIIEPRAEIERPEASPNYRWFPASVISTPKLPASIVPSGQSLMASAKVVQMIDAGDRLPITGTVEENILGHALHALFAADFINPQHPERQITIKRILAAYNLDESIKAQDVALTLDRFAALLNKLFQPQTILVETPFLSVNSHGQRTLGYIDLLLETSKGAVIIDHKSFLGKKSDWPAKALSYSGQLAAYRGARGGSAIDSTWIHFAAGGGLVQVEW
jgi:ATP-dependent helicase/nuclease subunit A